MSYHSLQELLNILAEPLYHLAQRQLVVYAEYLLVVYELREVACLAPGQILANQLWREFGLHLAQQVLHKELQEMRHPRPLVWVVEHSNHHELFLADDLHLAVEQLQGGLLEGVLGATEIVCALY